MVVVVATLLAGAVCFFVVQHLTQRTIRVGRSLRCAGGLRRVSTEQSLREFQRRRLAAQIIARKFFARYANPIQFNSQNGQFVAILRGVVSGDWVIVRSLSVRIPQTRSVDYDDWAVFCILDEDFLDVC